MRRSVDVLAPVLACSYMKAAIESQTIPLLAVIVGQC